jgi:hypothetical protein
MDSVCIGALYIDARRLKKSLVPHIHYAEALPEPVQVCERVPSCAHARVAAQGGGGTAPPCTGCALAGVYHALVGGRPLCVVVDLFDQITFKKEMPTAHWADASRIQCLGSAPHYLKLSRRAIQGLGPSRGFEGLALSLEHSQVATCKYIELIGTEPCPWRRQLYRSHLVEVQEHGLCALEGLYEHCRQNRPSDEGMRLNCNFQALKQGCPPQWAGSAWPDTAPDLRDSGDLLALHTVSLRVLHVAAFKYTKGFLRLRMPLQDYRNPYGRLLEGLAWTSARSPAQSQAGIYKVLCGVSDLARPMLWRALHMTPTEPCSLQFAIALVRAQALQVAAIFKWGKLLPAEEEAAFREKGRTMAAEGRAWAQELIEKCPQLTDQYQGNLVCDHFTQFNRLLTVM